VGDDPALLTISEAAERARNDIRDGLSVPDRQGRVRTVRRDGCILISEAKLQRCFPRQYFCPAAK
jgi:hypothetical protein